MASNNAYKSINDYLADKYNKLIMFETLGHNSRFNNLKRTLKHTMIKKKGIDFDFWTWYNQEKTNNPSRVRLWNKI